MNETIDTVNLEEGKMPDQIKADLDTWKIRINHRRKGRMKLQFNLSQEEAEALKNFGRIFKPLLATRKGIHAETYSEDELIKDIFLTGFAALNTQFQQFMHQAIEENKEELEKEGLSVVEGEDGILTLSGSPEAMEKLDTVEVPGLEESTDE